MSLRTAGRVRLDDCALHEGWSRAVILWACCVVACVAPYTALAQVPDQGDSSIFVAADRKISQALKNSQELLKEQRYSEAVRLLGSVLDSPEDFFVRPDRVEAPAKQPAAPAKQPVPLPNKAVPVPAAPVASPGKEVPLAVLRSLKSQAQQLIGSMPTAGREAYELQFGTEARRRLDEASAQGSISGLAEVSRRFFYTAAGHDATELLGIALMQRGQPLAAALCFKRLGESPSRASYEPALSLRWAACLARAGQRDQAQAVLEKASAAGTKLTVNIEGQESSLSNSTVLAAWLYLQAGTDPAGQQRRDDPHLMYRGNAARNGVSAGSAPLLNRRWAIPTLYDPEPRKLDLERLVEQRRQGYVDQSEAAIPSAVPIAANDHIVLRTVLGIMAVNFRTGKRIWFQEDANVRLQLDKLAQETGGTQPIALPPWLEQRVWNDSIYGGVASDGQYVLCVEDLSTEVVQNDTRRVIFNPGRLPNRNATQSHNRLAAYGFARQGALECDSSDVKELEGAFFLGAPLPLDGRFYTLYEQKGEIRLAALKVTTSNTTINPRTNKPKDHHRLELEWSQQLVAPERSVLEDSSRRIAGATPSYADGVLVCPTTAGAIVAVDAITHSLLWGYQYNRADPSGRHNMGVFGRNMQPSLPEGERWLESVATIAAGKVLITPVEGRKLVCLDLTSGKQLWEAEREDGLLVAGVYDQKVLVIGGGTLRTHELATGKKAWTTALPSGSSPSGRGFLSEGRYCLPISSAEVASFDLKTGEIVARSRSRDGQAVGNLICYEGAVISQSALSVESFYQLSDLQEQVVAKLAKDPNDPAALALEGDLLLDQGELDKAITALRRSQQLRPDPRTRHLLFDGLLERLQRDFVAGRKDLNELEGLIDQPSQRLAWLRAVANGYQQVGEIGPAFATYLRLTAEQPAFDELERIERGLAVRRDRWIQARMKDLREKASAAELKTMETALSEELNRALTGKSAEALRRFIDYFGAHPLADDARVALVGLAGGVGSKLEEELLLRRLMQSSNPERSAFATARLARLLHEIKRDLDAAPLVEQLRGPLAEVVCLEGKTGRELISQWYGASPPRQQTALSDWPLGKIEVESNKNAAPRQGGMQNVGIDIRGGRGLFFEGWSLDVAVQQQTLIGRDRLGREQWRLSLIDRNNRNPFYFQPSPNHARVDGHLLVVALGFQMLAIDTLGSVDGGPKVLWQQDLVDPQARDAGGLNWRQVNLPWGAPRIWAFDQSGRPLGTTGPVTSEFVCFQRQRNLICLHPLTGKKLWTRSGLAVGSELFGDDNYLFVIPSNPNDRTAGDQEAIVYRTLDGQELGRRKVPPVEQRLITLGSKMLVWKTTEKPTLKLRDLWSEKDEWTRTFEPGSQPYPIGDEAAAVFQRDGHFLVLNASDGKPTIDIHLRDEPTLKDIAIHRSAERDILIVNRPPKNADAFNIHVLPQGAPGLASIHGWAYAFERRNGKLIWERQVERHSLPHNQPPDMPVLVFASILPNQGGAGTQQASLWCLDKRDGRIVLDDKYPNQGNMLEMIADTEKHEVALKLMTAGAKLTFTDKPSPAAVPKKPNDDKKADR